MITKTDETTTALILAGEGYSLTIAPEAEARKLELITAAGLVTSVTDNDQSADAQVVSRRLAQMRIEVEKSRKAVKEPVNRIGKLIDAAAKDFLADLELQEKRITRLVGDHAAEVARARALKEAEERRAFEAARAAREASEIASLAAASSGRIADKIAAMQADKARTAALDERMAASAEVVVTKVAEGVRFTWDFEVADIHLLAERRADLVTIEPRRAAILSMLKLMDESGGIEAVAGAGARLGLKVFKKPVVSSR